MTYNELLTLLDEVTAVGEMLMPYAKDRLAPDDRRSFEATLQKAKECCNGLRWSEEEPALEITFNSVTAKRREWV